MGRRVSVSKGQRTKVFRLFSSSVPSTINFEAVADGPVGGVVEVDRWHWFSWKTETHPLVAHNAIEKGFADADFVIHVTPDVDCDIVFGRKTGGGALTAILLVAVVIVAIAFVLIALTAPPPGG